MEDTEEQKTVASLTVNVSHSHKQEIKAIARPEFEQNPEKYYPVTTLANLGFHRNQCPKCNHYYWRRTEARDTCGDA